MEGEASAEPEAPAEPVAPSPHPSLPKTEERSGSQEPVPTCHPSACSSLLDGTVPPAKSLLQVRQGFGLPVLVRPAIGLRRQAQRDVRVVPSEEGRSSTTNKQNVRYLAGYWCQKVSHQYRVQPFILTEYLSLSVPISLGCLPQDGRNAA